MRITYLAIIVSTALTLGFAEDTSSQLVSFPDLVPMNQTNIELARELVRFNVGLPVSSIVFSNDALVAADFDNILHVWNLQTLTETQILSGHSDMVWEIVYAKTTDQLFTASWDGTIRTWDLQTGETEIFAELPARVWDIDLSPDETILAAAS